MHNRLSPSLLLLIFFSLFAYLAAAPFHSSEAYAAAKSEKKQAKKSKVKRGRASVAQRAGSAGANDSRFAALVVNANTGEVLYENNANGIRHPASLTKMMTLYLTFEALRNGKISMETALPVSAKAAGQPPTNINLSVGDYVRVQTAIDALIVRSANDVAMVVAEALGGTQFNFAVMMNNKARQLGMNNTVFHNPSGLPDSRQISTATDLAKLAMALRRDFPEYYAYFSHRAFYFGDRRYEGHNRLLGRYPGADGVKTGYIGASGFNLVTSVRRGGTSLVGVIMGGKTAASRDQQMIDMLDNVFITLARSTEKKQYTTAQAPSDTEPSAPPRYGKKPESTAAATSVRAEKVIRNWSIQIGTFTDKEGAKAAISSARNIAPTALNAAKSQISSITQRGKPYTRARLGNLSADQAKQACAALSAKNRQCVLIRGG